MQSSPVSFSLSLSRRDTLAVTLSAKLPDGDYVRADKVHEMRTDALIGPFAPSIADVNRQVMNFVLRFFLYFLRRFTGIFTQL